MRQTTRLPPTSHAAEARRAAALAASRSREAARYASRSAREASAALSHGVRTGAQGARLRALSAASTLAGRAAGTRSYLFDLVAALAASTDAGVRTTGSRLAGSRAGQYAGVAVTSARSRPFALAGGALVLGFALGLLAASRKSSRSAKASSVSGEENLDSEFEVDEPKGVVAGEGDARSPAGMH